MSQHSEHFAREVYCLTKASFHEPKCEIIAEFSSKKEKIIKRFSFYPMLKLRGVQHEALEGILVSLGVKGALVENGGDLTIIKATSFSTVKRLASSLAVLIGKKPVVLEPERAFLLEKGWHFLDAFVCIGGELYRASEFDAHDFRGSVSTKELPFSEALRINEDDALFLVEQAAWSSLLGVPAEKVPQPLQGKLEMFIENIFFKHGELIEFDLGKQIRPLFGFEPLTFGKDLSKLDFSLVWAELFSKTFFNIGPETRNCFCCEPVVLEAKNILPSSLLCVRFLEDNLFFESTSPSFSSSFHFSNPFGEQRSSKKREYFLETHPVGPFYRGSEVLVPVEDAKRLIADGKASIVSGGESSRGTKGHELSWFCLNRESFFSKEVRLANAGMVSIKESFSEFEQVIANSSFDYYFLKARYSVLSRALSSLPAQLTNPSSQFFVTHLARSIISVQEATIAKFKEFSEKKGYRVLHANSQGAFVKGHSSLKLAKEFAAAAKLPQPVVAGFSSKRKAGFS